MNGLGVGDLRDVQPEVLSAAARRVEEHRLAVVKVVETVLRGRSMALSGAAGAVPRVAAGAGAVRGSRWSGPAASAAAGPFSGLANELLCVAKDLGVCSQALSHAGLRLGTALGLIARAEARAGERGARVTVAGDLIVSARASAGDPVLDAHEAREDALMREEVTAYLRQAERVATETDVELARHLLASAAGTVAAGERGVLTPLAPPGVGGPGPSSGRTGGGTGLPSLSTGHRASPSSGRSGGGGGMGLPSLSMGLPSPSTVGRSGGGGGIG